MMPGKIPDPMSSKGDIDLTKIKWHALSPEEALEILGSSKKGLSAEEAKRRLEIYGYNELEEKRKKTVWGTFVEQFKSFLVAILLFAILFSIIMEDFIDAGAIASILIINAVLGTVQEYRAEKSLEALKRLAAPKAKVIREGLETVVPAKELVPGDLVVLRVGDKVPADCRLVESYNLRCDEAILTGESVPVEKDPTVVLDEATPLPERRNMAYSSTTITYGHGIGVVVSTGMNTEVGKIAEMLRGEEEGTTPLQERLDRFGKKLGVIILLLCAIVAVSEIIEYGGLHDLKVFENAILTSISLAVSAVPEGLPAVVTVTLAMGMRRMARRNAIVRKLAAVETLGSATVICSDKTGTITRNEMTVREVWIYDKTIEVTGEGYKPQGKFILRSMDSSEEIFPKDFQGLSLLLKTGVLCNDASLVYTEGELHTSGDPTELALVVLGAKAGMLKERLEEEEPRVDEIPFDSARKMMTTIHKSPETLVAYSKGAPEALLKVCDRMLVNGKIMELSDDKKAEILSNVEDMAKRAMRVLALAYKEVYEGYNKEEIENGMIFLGIVGMIDPPRAEVKDAVKLAKQAGLRIIMVTGDHKLTAEAIAKEVGIIEGDNPKVITGEELESMTDDELDKAIEEVTVFARVSPKHKLRIVDSLKRRDHIVAMTGDGVNDAPSVKRADIGIAMGIRGSDVTKEAADMVLADDNFATIVAAIEEGRTIYENIRKFIRLLLSANWDEIGVVFIAALAKLPVPFLPIQILWINLVTDGLPALALGMDPPDPDVMKKPPRDPKEEIYHGIFEFILVAAIIAAAGSLVPFYYILKSTGDVSLARTVAFTVAVFFEMFLSFNCRSPEHYIFASRKRLLANKPLFLAVVASFLLQLTVIYVPFLQMVFETASLGIREWLIVMVASSGGLFLYPKLFKRKLTGKQ